MLRPGSLKQPSTRGRRPRRLDDLHDRQAERLRELVVALVVRGHGHDRAVAVAHQHVVRDPDRDAAAPFTGLIAYAPLNTPVLALSLWRSRSERLRARSTYVAQRRDVGAGAAGREQRIDQRMLGRHHHVRRAEQRVRAAW